MTQDEITQDIARRVIGGMLLSLTKDPFVTDMLNRVASVYIKIPDRDLVRTLEQSKGNVTPMLFIELVGQFPKFFEACDALDIQRRDAASYIEYATLSLISSRTRRYMRFNLDPDSIRYFAALLLSEMAKHARQALWRDAHAMVARFTGRAGKQVRRSLISALVARQITSAHMADLLKESNIRDYSDEAGVTDEELESLCRVGFIEVIGLLTRGT